MKLQVMVAGAAGKVTEPVLLAPLVLLLLLLLLGGRQTTARSSGETSPGLATATFNPADELSSEGTTGGEQRYL